MNPGRLAELNHQRALVREQLAWLDREIAMEKTREGAPSAVTSPPTPASILPSQTGELSAPAKVPDEIERYQPDPVSAASDTRRGCFIAIAISALVLIGAFAAIYLLRYSDRPLLFISDDSSASESTSPISSEPAGKK